MTRRATLTEGPVGRQLITLTIPMIGGIFAMSAFHLTDTYFVSRLGTPALAAMSFTAPVVMLIRSVAWGLGIGASSVISRAIGEGDHHKVQRLTTDCLILTVVIVGLLAMIGLLTMTPLFRLLGATDDVLPLIRSYMTIWYLCIAVLVLPMVGNNAIRATGDTVTPSLIMMISAGLNIILDPIMIFGLFGFPRLELFGAALATVVARALGLVAALAMLHFRCRLLDFSKPSLRGLLRSWRRILHVALPAAGTSLLMPISRGVVTRLVAGYGAAAVAGAGAAGRIQMFTYIVPMAMGTTLMPFIGQNWGGKRPDRVRAAWGYASRFGFFYGLVSLVLMWPCAAPLARLFSKDPEVVPVIARYLVIIFIGSGLQHISVHAGYTLNAMGKPFSASLFNVIRLVGLMIPLPLIGSACLGLNGVFWGLSLANIVAGIIAFIWVKAILSQTGRGA